MIQWKCVTVYLLLLLLFDHVLKKFLCANTFTDFIIIKRIDCLGSQCHFHENLATFKSIAYVYVCTGGTLNKYICIRRTWQTKRSKWVQRGIKMCSYYSFSFISAKTICFAKSKYELKYKNEPNTTVFWYSFCCCCCWMFANKPDSPKTVCGDVVRANLYQLM